MKKSVLMAALGLMVSMASTHGQGYVAFNSYSCNQGAGAIALFTGVFPGYTTGPLSMNFSADLYYAFGTVPDPVSIGNTWSSLDSAFTDLDVKGATYSDGYFEGPTVIIPGYTTGPISFEVVAFDGSSYDSLDTIFRGRSGAFTESMIANSASSPLTLFGDNGPGMPDLDVEVLPEPTTLALAGLSGLVSLVAYRRKQA